MSVTPVRPLRCLVRHSGARGDADREGLWGCSRFSTLSFCPLLFGLDSPPLPAGCVWEQVARARGVYMDHDRAMLLQARPTQSSQVWRLLLLTRRRRAGQDENNEEEKDDTGVPCFVRLRIKKLNIFNHAHNLLIDIGSLTLKKETVKHSRRTLVLLNIMLNLIFVVVVFVDCFLKYLCAVRPLICFGLYMCGILKK